MSRTPFPPFDPHPLLRSGHLQTLAGVYLPGLNYDYNAVQHRVELDDGDQLVLHDDEPAEWQPGDRVVLLMHGLSGCHLSRYMQRVAAKLSHRGVRTFRMDLRGCGAGLALARLPYHSGRSDDVAAAVKLIDEQCPGSPVTAIGFSLGGNLVIKLLGELGEQSCGGLDSGAAVCPPVDLMACSQNLSRWSNKIYDKHFVKNLWARAIESMQRAGAPPLTPPRRPPRRLFEFDDVYTAPISGFGNAENYYRRCSSGQFAPAIRRPTFVLAAKDDPLIPVRLFDKVDWSSSVEFHLAPGGGHLGFIVRGGHDSDRRWADWRIIEWVESLPTPPSSATAHSTSRRQPANLSV